MNERILNLQALRDHSSSCVGARRLRSRLMRDSGMLALAAGLSLSQITSLEVKVGEWSPDDVSRLERGEFFLDLLKRFGEVGELYGPYIQH